MESQTFYGKSDFLWKVRLSMESQPQNPEFRINPENFHPCFTKKT